MQASASPPEEKPITDRIAISCVMDERPLFRMQTWNWLLSLRACGALEALQPVIHHIGDHPRSFLDLLERGGAQLVEVARFEGDEAHCCNKLQQHRSLLSAQWEHVLLADCDLAFVTSPVALVGSDEVRAKTVDMGNPPEHVLRQLLKVAGFEGAELEATPVFNPSQQTHAFNCNGGLYLLPAAALGVLSEGWPRWAKFCLGRQDVLGKHVKHADQLGFTLAMLEADLPFGPLPADANIPTHLMPEKYELLQKGPISSLHYHNKMDTHGLLTATGVPWVDASIAEVNKALQEERRTYFSNEIFWDFRYSHHSALGSGQGSRGAPLLEKQRILAPFADQFRDSPVLDVGCGDLEAVRQFDFTAYTGLDPSPTALKIGLEKRPDWSFTDAELSSVPDDAFDLVICLDVLIHSPTSGQYLDIVRNLIRIARKSILVSGYMRAEQAKGTGIVFYHEALDASFTRLGGIAGTTRLGGYRDVDVLHVEKQSG